MYSVVNLKNYFGNWTNKQYIVIDILYDDYTITEHWYSESPSHDKISQLGRPVITTIDRLKQSQEKPNRPLPWDWYKSIEDFVRSCKSRVTGIEDASYLSDIEKSAYN